MVRNGKQNKECDYRTKSGRISMKAIKGIAYRISNQFEVEKIILFGSYAYGKPKPTSDVDMLVVMNTDKKPFQQCIEIIDALHPMYFGIDLFIRPNEELKKQVKAGDWFFNEILEKGRVLYEK